MYRLAIDLDDNTRDALLDLAIRRHLSPQRAGAAALMHGLANQESADIELLLAVLDGEGKYPEALLEAVRERREDGPSDRLDDKL